MKKFIGLMLTLILLLSSFSCFTYDKDLKDRYTILWLYNDLKIR